MNGRRIFAAVTVGHLGIDIFNSMGPVLLAFLKEPLGLTVTQVGIALGLYQLLAGATQPAFGWLVDRMGTRFLGPASVAVNLACIGLAVAAAGAFGSYALFLIPFTVAAVASGAFHPLGVMHASTADLSRSSFFTAVFFFFGQVGLACGPMVVGYALDRAGLVGVYWVLLVVAPVPLFMAFAMGPRRLHERRSELLLEEEAAAGNAEPSEPVQPGVIGLPGVDFRRPGLGLHRYSHVPAAAVQPAGLDRVPAGSGRRPVHARRRHFGHRGRCARRSLGSASRWCS